jgi:hypothetical protein
MTDNNQQLANMNYYFTNFNRIEVIDNTGRKYVKYDVENVQLHVQDDGKTLKVFVKYTPEEEISND